MSNNIKINEVIRNISSKYNFNYEQEQKFKEYIGLAAMSENIANVNIIDKLITDSGVQKWLKIEQEKELRRWVSEDDYCLESVSVENLDPLKIEFRKLVNDNGIKITSVNDDEVNGDYILRIKNKVCGCAFNGKDDVESAAIKTLVDFGGRFEDSIIELPKDFDKPVYYEVLNDGTIVKGYKTFTKFTCPDGQEIVADDIYNIKKIESEGGSHLIFHSFIRNDDKERTWYGNSDMEVIYGGYRYNRKLEEVDELNGFDSVTLLSENSITNLWDHNEFGMLDGRSYMDGTFWDNDIVTWGQLGWITDKTSRVRVNGFEYNMKGSIVQKSSCGQLLLIGGKHGYRHSDDVYDNEEEICYDEDGDEIVNEDRKAREGSNIVYIFKKGTVEPIIELANSVSVVLEDKDGLIILTNEEKLIKVNRKSNKVVIEDVKNLPKVDIYRDVVISGNSKIEIYKNSITKMKHTIRNGICKSEKFDGEFIENLDSDVLKHSVKVGGKIKDSIFVYKLEDIER